ncbi:hypothetical protein Tco_1019622 [Tanacetum coccineum]|uniref:Uncharacterized protein n=1 Tax=Tanacetum coccineum TaxID=301880 RepID=A0ABQ5FZK6_9ASTR
MVTGVAVIVAISVISISSDSSEESVGTTTARVILFGTISTTIPSTAPTADLPTIHDDTPLIPTDTPTISPITPTIQYTSPFICTDSSDSDIPDRPPSQDPYEPIPIGRPYRTQPNGVRKMLTARKRVGPLPTHRLALRYSAYYSSNHFTFDDSSRDSQSYSFPEEGYVPYVPGEIKLGVDVEDRYEPYTESDVDSDIQVDIDACIAYVDKIAARGTYVRVVVETAAEEEVESNARGRVEVKVDPRVKSIVDDGVREPVREDVPDHVTADGTVEVTYEKLGDLVQRFHDHTIEIPVHWIQVIESVQRFQGHRIVATSQQSAAMSERIGTLERDNTRLRGMLDVERQIVDRLRHSMSHVQRELRQIRHFRFYDHVRIGRIETHARRHLGYRP